MRLYFISFDNNPDHAVRGEFFTNLRQAQREHSFNVGEKIWYVVVRPIEIGEVV